MASAVQSSPDPAFLAGGGDTARLIADHDWSRTALGPIAGWPAAVKSTVALILRSPLPIVTLWGEPGVMIYNDAYSRFAGHRHPQLLGMDVRNAWPEVADFNDHIVRTVFGDGETLSFKAQELSLYREGRPDTVWLDLDYSPILDEAGTRLGVIAIVVEQTDKVEADRQLQGERERLRQMYEQSPSFKALLEGPDHRFVMVNDAYMRLVGQRDVIDRTVAEVVPEAVGQGYIDLLDTAFRTGQAFASTGARLDIRRTDDGPLEERFVDFVYQPVSDGSGTITGIFVDGVDVTERVVAQERIAASENQFRTFAQSMPNQVWTAPADGQLDWFNDRVYAYSGLDFAALKGEGWASLVHPDDLPAAAAAWGQSLAEGTTYETEFRIRRHDGDDRWHLVRALPIRGADDLITRWIGTNTDIHDQKLAEAQSARDRDRLWALSQDLLLVCDDSGWISSVNPSAMRLLGFAEDDMVGHRIAEFIHPDDVEATAAEVAKLSAGATTLAFENRYRTADGTYRLLDWTAVPEGDRIHAVGRDITEERRLARDRERIWTLSPIVKVVAEGDGTVVAVNPSWTAILGWSSEESVGRNLLDFLADVERPGADQRLSGLRDREVIVSQRRFRTRDGEDRMFDWTTVPDGGAVYLFGRDISAEIAAAEALEATEAALRQSQKMEAVGQLTGGIAHDFNNLLQGITGSLEIIQRRVAQRRFDELERFITGATGAANRAAALTHRLLAFSRRQPLDPRPVRINPLLESMEDLLRRTIGEGIRLDLVQASDAWLTRCDPNQLENAILNLVINARDAMPDGGLVTVATSNARLEGAAAGDYVLLAVGDTGVGMSPDVIARAFEPFFTTKPIGQGTGLGLSMIYGFARQSEGEVRIVSEEGQGTRVELYLPRFEGAADAELADAPPPDQAPSEDGETVLVVEDDPVVRELIVELLGDLGYRTLQAADGARGVELLCSPARIDLLVTDIGLPGLNGRQVADAGRVVRPGLRILFMTGYAENAALATGFLEPGMAMITKPFAIDELTGRVREMLETAG